MKPVISAIPALFPPELKILGQDNNTLRAAGEIILMAFLNTMWSFS